MAKSKKLPPPQPPSSSSEEEEEEEESSDDDLPPSTAKPTPQTPTKPKPKLAESESDDDSSDEDVGKSQPATKKPQPVKGTPSKPEPDSESEPSEDEDEDEDEGEDEVIGKSKPANGTPSKPAPGSSDSGLESEEDSKPTTLVSPSKPETSEKSNKFKRIFSLDDEITILNKLVEYQAQNGPFKLSQAIIDDLHEFMKKFLSVDVFPYMLFNKIRGLKKKYLDGRNHKSDKRHDLSIHELGKKIWGDEVETVKKPKHANSNGVSQRKSKKDVKPDGTVAVSEAGSLKREFPLLMAAAAAIGSVFAVDTLERIDEEELIVYERKLKKHKVAEMKLMHDISEFIVEKAEEEMD